MFVKVVLISENDDTFCRQLKVDANSHDEANITKCSSDGLVRTVNCERLVMQ